MIELDYKTELVAWLRSKKPVNVRFSAEYALPLAVLITYVLSASYVAR